MNTESINEALKLIAKVKELMQEYQNAELKPELVSESIALCEKAIDALTKNQCSM